MKPIKGSINVNNIDKSRLFDGKKGKYLDFVLIPTPNGQYYEWMVVQDTNKDEDSIIIGNAGKIFTEMPEANTSPNDTKEDSGLPF